MNFFDSFARLFDRVVSENLSSEILLIGMFFLISNAFLILILIHLFSKDFIAKEGFIALNNWLRKKIYEQETEKIIIKKFKEMPYRFYENRNNLDFLKFHECVPYYESSKNKGKVFFAVFSLVVSFSSLIIGFSFNNCGLILLSDAFLIFIFGIIFSIILFGIYIYIKQKTHKSLELNFNEFLKLLKSKRAGYETTKKLFQNINKSEKPSEEVIKSENFLDLIERIREVKVKDAGEDKIKNLVNDLANERNKITDLEQKEYLTDALTDLLNMLNKGA